MATAKRRHQPRGCGLRRGPAKHAQQAEQHDNRQGGQKASKAPPSRWDCSLAPVHDDPASKGKKLTKPPGKKPGGESANIDDIPLCREEVRRREFNMALGGCPMKLSDRIAFDVAHSPVERRVPRSKREPKRWSFHRFSVLLPAASAMCRYLTSTTATVPSRIS